LPGSVEQRGIRLGGQVESRIFAAAEGSHVQRRVALASLLLTAVATVAAPVRTVDSQAHALQDALQQVLAAAVDRQDTPGAVGLVVDKNGVLFVGAAGKSDVAKGTPLGIDAIFGIKSMTKPVTSVAAMMLVEQGKLSLEDPVSKYLPSFDQPQVVTKFNEADGTYETRLAGR